MFENGAVRHKTARRIQETQALKQKAVEVEDYDEAKRLRDVMSRLRKFGAAVAALEAKKMNAVRLEDYDTAKTLKAEIEKMDFDAFEKSTTTTHQNNNNNNSAASSPILGMRVKNDENGNEIVVNALNKSFDFDTDDGGAKGRVLPRSFRFPKTQTRGPTTPALLGYRTMKSLHARVVAQSLRRRRQVYKLGTATATADLLSLQSVDFPLLIGNNEERGEQHSSDNHHGGGGRNVATLRERRKRHGTDVRYV